MVNIRKIASFARSPSIRTFSLMLAAVALVTVLAVFASTASAVSPYQINVSTLPHGSADGNKVQVILSIVFGIIGALSLLMVTVGGFRYVASQGNPQAATKAKDTIVYALVGLLVSISAIAIVTFVVGRL
jgi:hypothetical protein